MICPKCSCEKFKRSEDITDFFCFNCGTIVQVGLPVPSPIPPPVGREKRETCRAGHSLTDPDNLTTRGQCKTCQREYDKKRSQDPSYAAYRRAYRGKAVEESSNIVFGKARHNKREIGQMAKDLVRRHIKQINRWRGLNVTWSTIASHLGWEFAPQTLAGHHKTRGVLWS